MIATMNFDVFAATTSLGIIKFIFIISAYLLPYILIPFMIKSLSGVFGNLAGAVNDRSKGLLDRNAKFRQNKRAEKMAAAKNFQRFNGNGLMARSANSFGGVLRNAPTRNKTLSKGGRAALRQSGLAVQGEADLKNDQVWQANQNDDKFLLAVANRKLAKEKMNAALTEGNTETTAGYQRALDAASQLQSSKKTSTKYTAAMALAKTGYQYSSGDVGYQELRDTMGQFAGGDQGVLGSMMNEAQFHLKNAGRLDLAGINDGAGNNMKSGFRKMGNYQRGQGKSDTYHGGAAAWLGNSSVGPDGKTAATSGELATNIVSSINNGETTASDISEYHSMLIRDHSSATDANKIEIQKQIDAIEGVARASATANGGNPSELSALIEKNRQEFRSTMIPESERSSKGKAADE